SRPPRRWRSRDEDRPSSSSTQTAAAGSWARLPSDAREAITSSSWSDRGWLAKASHEVERLLEIEMRTLSVFVVAGFLITAPAAHAAAQDPLEARVTMDYRNAAAADVLGALARGAGFEVEIAPGDLRPVTITVTNVRLGTALNAVCENASCRWSLQFSSQTPIPQQGVLKVTPFPN